MEVDLEVQGELQFGGRHLGEREDEEKRIPELNLDYWVRIPMDGTKVFFS